MNPSIIRSIAASSCFGSRMHCVTDISGPEPNLQLISASKLLKVRF